MSVAFKEKSLRESALGWRESPYEASGLDAPPRPLQIFGRIGLLLAVAYGFALTAQWLIGAPLGNG